MRILGRLIVLLAALAVLAAVLLLVVAPRMAWDADSKPGPLETRLASNIIDRWVSHNASARNNPVAATPENLQAARNEYNEHCAPCHALDGSGANGFEARFYPPVPRLDQGLEDLSDGELFFIVSQGIRYTAMPSFGENHSPEEIWKLILWVRHLSHLTPAEKKQLEAQMHESAESHEQIMHEGQDADEHPGAAPQPGPAQPGEAHHDRAPHH